MNRPERRLVVSHHSFVCFSSSSFSFFFCIGSLLFCFFDTNSYAMGCTPLGSVQGGQQNGE